MKYVGQHDIKLKGAIMDIQIYNYTTKSFTLLQKISLLFILIVSLGTYTQLQAQTSVELTSDNVFKFNGITNSDESGSAVASGDINGDGIDDFIIGAPFADPNGQNSGQTYIVFGSASSNNTSLNLSSLNGTNGFAINGINAHQQSGSAVTSEDINGDGTDDLIIGAPYANPNGSNSGQTYVVFGSDTLGSSGSIELSSLNGTNGFALNGIDTGDQSGSAVAGADIDGDGTDDLIIGAPYANPNGSNSGQTYVVFGSDTLGSSGSIDLSSLNGTNGFALNGIDTGDQSGSAVAGADINGDGTDDLIIGAPLADPNGRRDSGESYVIFGGSNIGGSGTVELSSLHSASGFIINGLSGANRSGSAVASGDINGDGTADIIIGAPFAGPNGFNSGQTYVVFGSNTLGSSGSIELSSLNGGNGFALNGINAEDKSGSAVASGDINGDGTHDLLIGAPTADPNGSSSGQIYVVFGGTTFGASGIFELTSINGSNGFFLNGISSFGLSGWKISSGDIKGERVDAVLIGAPQTHPNGKFQSGQSYGISLNLKLVPVLSPILIENALPLNSNLDIAFKLVSDFDFTFDGKIDGNTVTQTTFQVHGSQTGKYSGIISGRDTNTITFNPDTNFKPGELITVTLNSSIATPSGFSLDKNYTISFITNSEPVAPENAIPNTISSTVSSPVSVISADIDGDGDLDLVSASSVGNAIIWHRNNGTGGFARFTVANGLSIPADVRVADVDSDGDMDILSANEGNDVINWYRNNGSETFLLRTINNAAEGVQSIFTADLDGDGDTDVLSASENDNTIAWYENNGSETFTKKVVSNAADGAVDVLAADINGDGSLDIVASAANEDTLAWYKNVGDSVFIHQTISTSLSGITRIAAIDIDGDGDMDVAGVSPAANTVAWFENDGSQSFTGHTITSSATAATALHVVDYNGDGHVDLLSTGANTDTLTFYKNDGSQNFSAFSLGSSQEAISSLTTADIDGNGGLNIISSSRGDNQILWYGSVLAPVFEQTGITPTTGAQSVSSNATISASFSTPIDSNTVTSSSFIVSSNKTSLVSGTRTVSDSVISFQPVSRFLAGDVVTVTLTKTITDTFGESRTVSPKTFDFVVQSNPVIPSGSYNTTEISSTAGSLHYITSADIDRDGDMDVAAASGASNTIVWYENDGTQSYTGHTVADDLDFATSVFATDLDSDGDMDLLSSSRNNNTIVWHKNDGSQNFTSFTIANDVTSTEFVAAYDVNSDGNMDVLAASDTKVIWYENNGSESFTERVISSGLSDPRSLYTTDMDGDGDMDLLVAEFAANKIFLFENNGSESFTRSTVALFYNGPVSVFATDMDGDGDKDVLGAAFSGNEVSWFENHGNPSFTKRTISSGFGGARSVRAGDVDGDGDVDVVGTSQGGDEVTIFINDGSQNFTTSSVTMSADNARFAEFTDMDGDGDLDVVAASKNDETIAWYELAPSAANASLSLNGTDNFIDADRVFPHFSGSSAFTFEAWIKPDFAGQTDPNDVTILNFSPSGNRIFLGNNANKDQVLRVSGNATLTGPALTDGRWTHIAYTVSFGTGNLYVDGTSVGTHSTTASFSSDDNWNIGAVGIIGALSDIFAGNMDELRFWNTARSAEEIRRNMFQRVPKNAPGLVAYFPLDESSGSTVFDRSDNNIWATLSGTPNWSGDAHPYGTFITGSEGWRILTAPSTNISYSTLLDTLWTQGFTGADHSGGASNVYRWNESGFSFAALTDGSLIPASGEAFIAYVYDDQDKDGTADGFPKMIRIDSTQHSGDIALSLSYTDNGTPANDGWNLIGNPYGTSIDWDAPNGLSRSNLDASMYVWNHSAGSGNGAYQSWNGFAGTLSDGKLAPLQGFWVKANAANPSINFSSLARSTGGVFRKEQATQSVPQLTFTLVDSSGSSQTLVMFHEQALTGKDSYDAYKLGSLNGESLALYSLIEDNSALEINALPLGFEKPLDIPVSYSGSSEIDFSLIWNHKLLPEEWEFALIDNIAETTIDLRKDSVYTFSQDSSKTKNVAANEVIPPSPPQLVPRPLKRRATVENPRFTMRISKASPVSTEPGSDLPTKVELSQNYPNPFNPSTTIAYGLPQTGKVTLEVFDILGRRVATLLNGEQKAAGRHTVTFNASNLASGMYIYRLRAGNSVIIKKLTLIK